MENKQELSKEENFKLQVDRLREMFAEMPMSMLLVVQGIIVESAQEKLKSKEKGE